MIKLNIETGLSDTLKLKNANRYLVEGWIFGPSRIKKLFICLDDKCYEAKYLEIFRPDIANQHFHDKKTVYSMFSGFSVPITLTPVQKLQEKEVVLKAEFKNGESFTYQLGNLKIEPWEDEINNIIIPDNIDRNELLVICMATYNPDESRFKQQIESIVRQDYTNWICIVCDDCSDMSGKRYIRKILSKDSRFILIENPENVGFYYNFERCLELVPPEAKYVALADQDDYWYSDKLSKCHEELTGDTQLVYCDMRIVHENGEVLAETYWKNRKNYYKSSDIDLLAIANTVTGAASVFRASLLERILPFPPRYGNVFHDQWIAIIAAATGGIKYVDAALYDYIQNDENVIGHFDFGQTPIKKFLMIDPILESYKAKNLPISSRVKSSIFNTLLVAKEFYEFEHSRGKHISTIIETTSIRIPDSNYISLIRRGLNIPGLLKMRVKIVRQKDTTDKIELSLLISKIINKVYTICIPILSRFMLHKAMKQSDALTFNKKDNIKNICGLEIDEGIAEFKRKFTGRQYTVIQKKPQMNIFLSLIDPANFFGGYIGMFNFAKKFFDLGYSIRIILTDQDEIVDAELEKIKKHDTDLRPFLANAEYQTCFSSKQELSISTDDIFVATSWWTAHIAHEAVSKTNYSKFIYLAQDYEPIFYEHGAYRVLAEQSYRFDCFPLFSTDILQKYFIRSGVLEPENTGMYFKNPVLKFDLTTDSHPKNQTRKKKLLFYARPQPHNARNLYPIGCLAIDKARELGYFQDDEWEIIGIGGDIGEQILPSGIKIKHIGKFSIQKYKELLPQHDLGLALMDSPHPSLLPIEMASAGLLVVTNTYDIKNQEYFSDISENIKAVYPDYESLANALIEQSEHVDNFDDRIKGSKVNWPHDWDEALPLSTIEKAIESVVKSKK